MGKTLASIIVAALLMLSCTLMIGCDLQQQANQPRAASAGESQPMAAAPSAQTGSPLLSTVSGPDARPLPFAGRLIEGDRDELPPVIARSLSDKAPITFSYREQISHDDYHIPLAVTALDPVTYFGAPLGDYGVTAFAVLTIQRGDTIIGDYSAKAHISKSYTLYSQPTHRELEEAARAAVRAKIDARIEQDEARLAQAASSNTPPPSMQATE